MGETAMPRWSAVLDALRYDAHFALRGFRRRPAFTAMVVATLALGIGANATMFGLLDRLLLQAPAHIANPDRVALFHANRTGETSMQTTQPYVVRQVLREQVSDFTDVAVATPTGVVRRQYYPVGRGPTASAPIRRPARCARPIDRHRHVAIRDRRRGAGRIHRDRDARR